MPLAVIYGLVFFGTFPDAQGWVGIALIVGAGLYTLWRETVMRGTGGRGTGRRGTGRRGTGRREDAG